ncbi:MAG: Crp/Fnr family transcriptional regulator [Sulfitobacter sp.]
MKRFKVGELAVESGTPLLSEGSSTPQVFTALSGMGLRYKTLENGERQVISFVMPGDFIGLQAAVMGEMQHSVEASTDMVLCVFDRSSLWDLFKQEPQRAFDLTWVAAIEEHFLGETVAALGQRTGTERVAWAMVRLFIHLSALDLRNDNAVPLPYRQQDLADALGLSLVHTNKILSSFRRKGLAIWKESKLTIPDLAKLADLASLDPEAEPVRPLI